jgi:hypothetical protein
LKRSSSELEKPSIFSGARNKKVPRLCRVNQPFEPVQKVGALLRLQAFCSFPKGYYRHAHRPQIKAPGSNVLAQRLILITNIAGDTDSYFNSSIKLISFSDLISNCL